MFPLLGSMASEHIQKSLRTATGPHLLRAGVRILYTQGMQPILFIIALYTRNT